MRRWSKVLRLSSTPLRGIRDRSHSQWLSTSLTPRRKRLSDYRPADWPARKGEGGSHTAPIEAVETAKIAAAIPAVIAFDKGQPVDGFMGAVPEAQIKEFITRLAGPAGPTPIEEAMSEAEALLGTGDVAQAAQLYAAVLAEEPENVDAIAALAKIQLDLGDIENAKQLVAMAPADKAGHAGLASIRAAIELAEQAAALGDLGTFQTRIDADPNDFQARFDLALGLNGRNMRDEAVDQLIEIERRDRTWNEGAARKQLLTFFEAWGLMDKASIRGRRRLSTLVFA